jgi:hypothetical protein
MDNKQLRTAMVTASISKYMATTILGEDGVRIAATERFESAKNIQNWRATLNLDLSIAARGATEGLWYIDQLVTPESPWADMMVVAQGPIELMMCTKTPNKILAFNPDQAPTPIFQKIRFPSTEVCFVNNQALWNFEHFVRDQSMEIDGKPYADIDYSVVDKSEIGQGEAVDFDLITMQAFECNSNGQLLIDCIEALAANGVLLINFNNNSGKLYRDDFWFHPHNEMHQILKSYDGFVFHDSAQYGFTVFVKN